MSRRYHKSLEIDDRLLFFSTLMSQSEIENPIRGKVIDSGGASVLPTLYNEKGGFFNGSNTRIGLQLRPRNFASSDFTISIVITPTSRRINANHTVLGVQDYSPRKTFCLLQCDGDYLYTDMGFKAGIIPINTIEINHSYHVLIRRLGSRLDLYLNGVLIYFNPLTSLGMPSDSLYLGCLGSSFRTSSYLFNGYLKNLRIYSKAISDTEIAYLSRS